MRPTMHLLNCLKRLTASNYMLLMLAVVKHMKRANWIIQAWFDDKGDEILFRKKLNELRSFAEVCIIKQQRKRWIKED